MSISENFDTTGPQASNSANFIEPVRPKNSISAMTMGVIAFSTAIAIYILMYFPANGIWFYVKAITIFLLMIISYSLGKQSGKIVISNEVANILNESKIKLEEQLQ